MGRLGPATDTVRWRRRRRATPPKSIRVSTWRGFGRSSCIPASPGRELARRCSRAANPTPPLVDSGHRTHGDTSRSALVCGAWLLCRRPNRVAARRRTDDYLRTHDQAARFLAGFHSSCPDTAPGATGGGSGSSSCELAGEGIGAVAQAAVVRRPPGGSSCRPAPFAAEPGWPTLSA